MWVRFLQADKRRIRPKAGGIVTSTIDYRAGMVENVPREYGERLVEEGKAEATVSPAAKGKADAPEQPSSGSGPRKPTAD